MIADETQFEEPILRLRRRIDELTGDNGEGADPEEIEQLRGELSKVTKNIYENLTPWQNTLAARHPLRPYTLDYISYMFENFVEVHGDRRFADDPAIVAGFGSLGAESCAIIGHQKGRDTKEKIIRNFGMPRPEGYRKALRIMQLAEKFRMPIFTFIDTTGAYPGVGAEERGQAEAIAVNLREMAALTVPIIVTVTGEGGSGGALALGVGDRILMLEHAVYSVISPEGCAAILWKDPGAAKQAAKAMKITAKDLKGLGVIDEIVPEPEGGAHNDHRGAAALLRAALERNLKDVRKTRENLLPEERYKKFRKMGFYEKA